MRQFRGKPLSICIDCHNKQYHDKKKNKGKSMKKTILFGLLGVISFLCTGCFESKSEEAITLKIDTASVLKGRIIESTLKVDNDTNAVIVQK